MNQRYLPYLLRQTTGKSVHISSLLLLLPAPRICRLARELEAVLYQARYLFDKAAR